MEFTALKKFFAVLLPIFVFLFLAISSMAYTTSEGVGVAAEVVLLEEQEVAIKGISGIVAAPSPARVGYVIEITVTLKGFEGMLLPFHSVRIEADGPGDFEITQPAGLTGYDGLATAYITSDVAGVYTVSAYDTTYSEKDIKINDEAEAIFLADGVPLLYSEPEFTQGYSNSLDWEPLENIVDYYIEASSDSSFKTIVYNSGWIEETEYEFTGLQDSIKYYFRVKGRNEVGAPTVWSNVVYSTQDATPPSSEVVNVEKLEGGFKVYIESDDKLGEVALVDIYVKMDDGKWVLIKSTEVDSLTIDFTEIEGFDVDNKPERICFYSRAEDTVGNLEPVDPGSNGDYCIGYGFTFQNIFSLILEQFEKLAALLRVLYDSLISYAVGLVENNLVLFKVLVFVFLIAYFLERLYEGKFRLSEINNWLELWNLKIFPWLVPDEEKKRVGVVYDAYTHEPLENVLVRLIYKDEVVQMSVTDKLGVFKLSVDDQKYTMTFWKAGYTFPSKQEHGVKDDIYELLYTGDTIVLGKDRKKLIGVPIDLRERSLSLFVLYWTLDFFVNVLRFLNPFLVIVGGFLTLVLDVVAPGFIFYFLTGIYVMCLADMLGFMGKKKVRWGVVRDEEKRKLNGLKIGLYSQKFNRLVDYRITDEEGRYRFVALPGRYFLKVLSPNYRNIEGDIMINFEKGRTIEIAKDMVVKKI